MDNRVRTENWLNPMPDEFPMIGQRGKKNTAKASGEYPKEF